MLRKRKKSHYLESDDQIVEEFVIMHEMEESWVKAFEEQTRSYNEAFLPKQVCVWLPHLCQTWLRLSVVGVLLYFGTSLFCLDFWKRYFAQGKSLDPMHLISILSSIFLLLVTKCWLQGSLFGDISISPNSISKSMIHIILFLRGD